MRELFHEVIDILSTPEGLFGSLLYGIGTLMVIGIIFLAIVLAVLSFFYFFPMSLLGIIGLAVVLFVGAIIFRWDMRG